MKFNKLTFLILAVAGLAVSASAQTDYFGQPRTIILTPPTVLAQGTTITTNSWVDTHGAEGIAKIDVVSGTNSTIGNVTLRLQTSSDQTNFTDLANSAYASPLAVIYTNTVYGGTLTATDNYLFPGTVTTPTAATAGFNTQYILPAPFTNTVTTFVVSNGVYEIGYNVADALRYVRTIYTTTTATNQIVGATLTMRRSQ